MESSANPRDGTLIPQHPPFTLFSPICPLQRQNLGVEGLDGVALDGLKQKADISDRPNIHTAVAATTRISQWRHDASLRVPSLRSTLVLPALFRDSPSCGSWVAFSSGCSPGSESSPPGRFSGRRPLVRSAIVRWQEATDPQSPKGGSQRASPH